MKKIDTHSRKFKYGSMASLFTVIVVVITILINIVANLVVEKFNLRFDMTDTKLYELSTTTKQMVPDMNQEITINVFNNKDDVLSILKEYIIRIAALNDKITINYIDPYTNPNMIEKYAKEGYAIQTDDVIVEGPQRKKYIDRLSFFNFNEQEGTITGVVAEQTLVSAFLYVTREELPAVVFSDGHNEEQNEALMKLFDNNSYVVYQAALAVQDIQEDAEIFVIAAPTRDFSPDEIKKLDAFMAEGKKIIAYIPPAAEAMPNLEGFLAEWGIGVRSEVVLEKELYIADNPLNLHAIYVPHIINNYFANNRYYPVLPACRALEVLEVPGGVTGSVVLTSSEDSYGKTGESFTTLKKEENDTAGPFALAVASQKRVTTAEGERDAKLFVTGSSMMFASDILSMASYANSDFIVQVINWCTDTDKGVNIPAKKLTPDPMNIMSYQVALFGLAFIIIIPLGILIYGIVVFFRRRHL
jgi:ABC-type uncharacterized transport system involved in gliding motility auxiliary subunit